MKQYSLLSICLFFLFFQSVGQRRFKETFFEKVDSVKDIPYGVATNIKGQSQELLLDIFMPQGDTLNKRPLLLFIHGGGFQNNSKTGSYSSRVCQQFAQQGYVTATINYRLGVEQPKTDKHYLEALYRAQQDGKAAIRFFRRYAEKYGIDTSQLFITGSSAGAMTCLAMAYMNESEVPPIVDVAKWGTPDGESGNPGYSSRVHGVINAWGALPDFNWIQTGNTPLFNISGTEDKTVPYDSSFDYHSFKYGGYILFQRCLSLGIPTGWRPFYSTGHTLDNNRVKQDSAIRSMSDWLYTQLRYHGTTSTEGVFRWEKDIVRFDSLNASEKYDKDALLFIGSSYIRMWKNIRQDLKYSSIIHRGFGGSNLRDVAFYINRIIGIHQPRAIFMYVGNDIVAGEKDKAPDQVLEHFKYVVNQIRTLLPTTPICWLAISPSEKRWAAWERVQQANKLIKDYAVTQSHLYFIDAGGSFIGKDNLPIKEYYLADKLHYNEKGYEVWGNAIRKQVKQISKKGDQ
ncbi:MAG: hypothetical protein RLZZ446_1079 [Bacteroidota bacterium]